MLRVNMFWVNENLVATESIIEKWLAENSDIEIKHILQSADGSNDGTAALISIWYTELSSEIKSVEGMIIISRDELWHKFQDCGASLSVFNAMFPKK